MTKIVTLGGGTGTFAVLSAIRSVPGLSITAIVASSDDGGSTGRLRDAYGTLPVGDARQALVALARAPRRMRELFNYRFSKGDVRGHTLGNLLLTALADLSGSDAKAIEEASKLLRVSGRVLCATSTATTLEATLTDGSVLSGERVIDERSVRAAIREVSLAGNPRASDEALAALAEADVLLLGPGDLYTSTIAALLPGGIREAVAASCTKIIYTMNLFTKAGQTDGMGAALHLETLTRYLGRAPDVVLMHKGEYAPEALARYAAEGEYPVADDLEAIPHLQVVRGSLASATHVEPVPEDPVPRSLVRHDPEALRITLMPFLVQ